MPTRLIAIDQGTTSTRAIVFDEALRPVASSQQEFTQYFPADGWVEHDPEEIWQSVLATVQGAMAQAGITAADVAAIGITNQRETTLIWDRVSEKPIHRAIVWQDRRTADACAALRAAGHEPGVAQKTGLLLDPYFSATKIAWLLDHVDGARDAAQEGRLAFGTIDTWLLWRLTGGFVHATDATNAARTLLLDIHAATWDPVPRRSIRAYRCRAAARACEDCAGDFGVTDARSVRRRRSASGAPPATSRRRRSGRRALSPV